MLIDRLGVLLTGDSGSGKSDLALALIDRGHLLVADDAVELVACDGRLSGLSPQALEGLIEVRGVGLVRVRDDARGPAGGVSLDLVVHLEAIDAEHWPGWPRLTGRWDTVRLAGTDLPRLHLPVSPGRPLPLLVETAVRHQPPEHMHV